MGLTQARFAKYTALIEEETLNYIQRWGKEGSCDLFHDLSELIIFTGRPMVVSAPAYEHAGFLNEHANELMYLYMNGAEGHCILSCPKSSSAIFLC